MKERKKTMVLVIVGIAFCCAGIYVFMLKFFFYNKYNVHAKRAMLDRLGGRYDQEFELSSTEFETKEVRTGGAKYVHIWTFELLDNQGRQFYAYVRLYGLAEKGDGNFHDPDYSSYIDDTYGQLCIEERLGGKYDLYQYRQEKGSRPGDSEWEDYIFICTKNNVDEMVKLLTEVYFKETEFSNGGCLKCLVNNEEGKELFSYYWWNITRELQKQGKEVTEQTVCAYMLQELQNKLFPHIASYNVEKSQNGYVVSITDIHGKLLYEDFYQLEPIISEIGKDTIMVTAGKGDSIAYKFINRKSGKISDSYENISTYNEQLVVYGIYENAKLKIVIRDIYDEDIVYKEITDQFPGVAVGSYIIKNAEIVSDNLVHITYYIGDNWKEKEVFVNLQG